MKVRAVRVKLETILKYHEWYLCQISRINHAIVTSAERSKGFATLRNVSKLTFFDKIGHVKSVGFRFIRLFDEVRAEITRDHFDSLIYSLIFSRRKELLLWLSRGLNQLTYRTRQIRGNSKMRD